MAEGNVSRYVKLTKEQTGVEEIKPGELNQPIEVPHVSLSLSLSLFFSYFSYLKFYHPFASSLEI
jgi:hypothetical protein